MSGPAGFSPSATRSGVMGQVRSISHRTWITLALVFGVILFLIVMGVLKSDEARQTAALKQEATIATVPEEVSGMIGDGRVPAPPPPPPEFPTEPPRAPEVRTGPTYEEMALARM